MVVYYVISGNDGTGVWKYKRQGPEDERQSISCIAGEAGKNLGRKGALWNLRNRNLASCLIYSGIDRNRIDEKSDAYSVYHRTDGKDAGGGNFDTLDFRSVAGSVLPASGAENRNVSDADCTCGYLWDCGDILFVKTIFRVVSGSIGGTNDVCSAPCASKRTACTGGNGDFYTGIAGCEFCVDRNCGICFMVFIFLDCRKNLVSEKGAGIDDRVIQIVQGGRL